MTEDTSRKDIRRLLKTFGIQADEAIVAHLARNPQQDGLQIRLVLEDLTDYGDRPPEERLHLEIEGDIQR
jgi:type IV pilus biogenesis protein CpaD/CtpE